MVRMHKLAEGGFVSLRGGITYPLVVTDIPYGNVNAGYIVKGFDNVKQFIFFKVEIHKIHLCFFRKLNRLKIDFVKVLYVYYTTFLK